MPETGAVRWSAWVGDPELKFLGGAVGRATVAGDIVVTAGINGGILGLDRATGQTRWHQTFGEEGISAGVVVLGSTAIFATWSGRVRALSLESGSLQWERHIGSAVNLPLTVGANRVYPNPGIVFAIGADGTIVWQYGGTSVGTYFSTPATYFDGKLYVAANNSFNGVQGGGLFALRVVE